MCPFAPAACNYLNADASSKINEFNCKGSFAVDQFYQRLVASQSPGLLLSSQVTSPRSSDVR